MPLHTFSIDAALAGLPGFPVLRGLRTQLRAPVATDADALFALYSDPDVMRYWPRAPMRERREAEGLLRESLAQFDDRTRIAWIVTARHADAAIGTCTLYDFDATTRSACVGYALLRERWGQGLARDAVSRAIAWGKDALGLARIEADIDPRNAASQRLLDALGFRALDGRDDRYALAT